MTRTTLDIDAPVLEEVKRLRDQEEGSLGKLVSRLLAEALASRPQVEVSSSLQWTTRPMGARIELMDKEALYAALDEPER